MVEFPHCSVVHLLCANLRSNTAVNSYAGRELRKGPWLDEEDDQLAAAVAVLGDRRWDALAKASGLKRSGKSCRLRWVNYLRPNLKHGNISAEEEGIIIQLHEKWGNRWSKIARRLPGRTDNEIKNYWRSYLKKKALVLEKGNNSLRSECEPTSPSSINEEWLFNKGDISLRLPDDSLNALDLMSLNRSPYETRLTEWISNDDLHGPEWMSEDCSSSVWDISLWGGE